MLFLFLILLVPHTAQAVDTIIIKGRTAGFFSNFLAVVNHLVWCHEHSKKLAVCWNGGFYYDPRGCNGIISNNVWDFYFYPVSDSNPTMLNTTTCAYYAPDGFAIATHPGSKNPYPDDTLRRTLHSIISAHVRIKEPTLQKIEEFYSKYIQHTFTVAIHLRGTDKYTEVAPLSIEYICQRANEYVPCQFYIATDDERLLEHAQKLLHGPIISYPCFRSKSEEGVHTTREYPAHLSRALLGEEALIECILLSRCNVMIHTWSMLSMTALLFNPDLAHVHLDRGV